MPKLVYDFAEGNKDLKDLLGGKGANLAEMVNLGLPVPPGFTITTEACRAYLAGGREPSGLREEVGAHLAALESRMGATLGRPEDPLLVSVRSGAKFSMPGMMDTVLNVGLNDRSVEGLAARTHDARFAWDSYRRLIQMFGKTVLGVAGEAFDEALDKAKRDKGVTGDLGLVAGDLKALVAEYKEIIRAATGEPFPQEPREQLDMAIHAVFDSWNGDRARLYRRQERIPHDLGTAVNVMAMVFGNLGAGSGTGVAFTRDPSTGRNGVYGDYLQNAQGEDVVAGIRDTMPLEELRHIDEKSYGELLQTMKVLENHYRDLCDIEFTIERGRLWMLQTRVGKRTAEAAFLIAVQFADEGLIDMDEALTRVTGEQLGRLMFPRFAQEARAHRIARGIAASPGAAVGRAVFDSETAVRRAAAGERVILVRRETDPDDLPGMIAAAGVLTSHGGKTSHAAVVARGMGTTCVCGAEALEVDAERRRFTGPGGVLVNEGEVISVDGSDGAVYLGTLPVMASPVMRFFEDGPDTIGGEAEPLVGAVRRIMAQADGARRLEVWANADTPEDAARARRFGAQGIGLCRTEHMFLGERRVHVERLILAEGDAERRTALEALLPLQRDDFVSLLTEMNGLPVTMRLLDPPLHEFLPDLTDLSVRVALAESRGGASADDRRLLAAVRRTHEQNPMLGLRGVRLGMVIPELFSMQVRAFAEAMAQCALSGLDPCGAIMIPLVGAIQELEIVRADAERVLADVAAETGAEPDVPIGTMIELPRAALTAGRLAEAAQFFSFGTNDLTQTVWGFSRDDVEGAFFTTYLDQGVFGVSPFETLDREGVGRLIEVAAREGRARRRDLELGVCGEHAGDPASIHYFHSVGIDYVSCSPFRVPIARLEAGRSAVASPGSDTR